MKVYLPSHGVLGIDSIDIRQPKINDLREISNLSPTPELKKTEFVKMLATSPELVDSISIFDRDYLFAIAVSALHLGSLAFKVECACSNIISDALELHDHPCNLPR